MPCGSSSNINVSKTFVEVNPAAFASSRFVVTIPSGSYAAGITGGDVIYYGVTFGEYRKAKADDPVSSEVFGIVESRNFISGSIDVVTQGSINFPSTGFTATAAGGGAGGLDVYFLSDTDAGKIQPLAPTEVGHIVKPVYQVGEHGGSYTGLVTNYIGYNIGTEVETTIGGFSSGVGSLVFTFGEIDDPSYVCISKVSNEFPGRTKILPLTSEYIPLFEKIGIQFGFIYRIQLKLQNASEVLTRSAIVAASGDPYGGYGGIGYYTTATSSAAGNSLLDSLTFDLNDITSYQGKYAPSIYGRRVIGSNRDGKLNYVYSSENNPFNITNDAQRTSALLRGSWTNPQQQTNWWSVVEQTPDFDDENYFYLYTTGYGLEPLTIGESPYQIIDGKYYLNDLSVYAPSYNNGLTDPTNSPYRFYFDTLANSYAGTNGSQLPSDIVLATRAEIVGFALPLIDVSTSHDPNIQLLPIQVLQADDTAGNATYAFNPIPLTQYGRYDLNVYMKVKDTGMSSYLPRSVAIEDTLEVPTLKYGAEKIDLETKIDSLISRLVNIENRLRIPPP